MHVKPGAPPLMRELYDEMARAFPHEWGAGSPLEKYRDQFRNDFEQTFTEAVLGITKDFGLPGTSLSLLEKLSPLALYFSRFVLDPTATDYYSKLLVALRNSGNIPRTVFGSLNYECLFEQAAQNLGLALDYEWDDAKLDRVCVAKLHGSCNFIRHLSQIERALLASTAVQVEVPLSILPVRGLEKALSEKLSAWECLPIMSQVSHYKEQLLAPATIQRMRNGWNAAVHRAKFVAIIGVSFNCYDRHIIEPIQNASGTVLYIGDQASFKMWHAANKHTELIAEKLEGGLHLLLNQLGIS